MKLEERISQIEKQLNKLTIMNNNIGICIRANNHFYNQYLKPVRFSFKFIDGKMGLATCTDATILIPKPQFSKFLQLFRDYVKKYHLKPEINIKERDYNFFAQENSALTYVEIYDKNEC